MWHMMHTTLVGGTFGQSCVKQRESHCNFTHENKQTQLLTP